MTEEKEQEKHQRDLKKESSEIENSKKYREILSSVIHEGEEIFKLKKLAVFLSACIAGLEIGFSYILISTLYFLLQDAMPEIYIFRLFGLVYPIGFILVVLGKSVLFTEQTSVLALPVLNGQRTILEMLKIWGIVISGNILGGIVFVLAISPLAPKLGIFNEETMISIGEHVISYENWVIFISAILAGWLMGLLTWLLNTTVQALTKIIIIILITGTIGFIGFHHSIVGNIEVFGAFLHSENISIIDYLLFLLISLTGNGVGGAIVVGLFKYRIFESNYSSD